jgi:hypothetical protein
MLDLQEQLQAEGKSLEAAVAGEAQAAWLAGRFEEWAEARVAEIDAFDAMMEGSQQGQPPAT